MLLRRVLQHLRKQEWTLIGIDLVIVVLGVFIGMQVQDWNSDRQARARADVFGERLRNDLRYEDWNYQFQRHYYQEALTNAERAVADLGGEKPLTDEAFVISAYRATQYRYNARRRATYDELVSTGTIGLLADQSLRTSAVAVFNEDLLEVTQTSARGSDFRKEFRRTTPARVQHALLEQCGDRDVVVGDYQSIKGSLDYPCTLGLPAAEIVRAAAALRGNSALLPALQERFADLETVRTDLLAFRSLRDGKFAKEAP